ncbi:nucleotide exchange factor GrpE [Nocardia harenae]|uniref:nucleotide exchange factor GrpE n=1 Tax=Nocardia harenae TaxID=358707 RepID=UPI00082F8095|nr:nucleotide exchange factor GrpE [Nocardia harenae]
MTHPEGLAAPIHEDEPATSPSPAAAMPAPGRVLQDLTEEIRRLNDRSESLEAINKRMHERVAVLEGDLLRASLRPVIKSLAELHGECVRNAKHAGETGESEGSRAFADDFLTVTTRIEDILEGLGAVTIGVEIGDPFDRRIHQPCGTVGTEIEAQHDRVSSIYHQGFRNISSDKPVVYAKVSVWKYVEH